MKVYFLGTMGWYDTPLGNTLCVLVDTGKEYIVFDAGGGFTKLDYYIKKANPVYLFLSHFHLDHIIGLHALNKFKFSQGLYVFGPPGTKKMFNLLINPPYSKAVNALKIRVRIKELDRNLRLPFEMEFKELFHTTVCYGYRLSCDDKTVSFCTDTGLCSNLALLAKKADLLIIESALRPGESDKGWPHLNPQQAATVARNCGVKNLALVHFDAADYPCQDDIRAAKEAARKIFKNSIAARDGLCLEI
ncbi:MAG: MBL fold metallo-hydrolase [Candidatus Omnitrophica bacterium]|nr:MBL fold metallo-hydrolase [Candidatus Omnitrophota bacterium]